MIEINIAEIGLILFGISLMLYLKVREKKKRKEKQRLEDEVMKILYLLNEK